MKYRFNEGYREIARALVDKFEELQHIQVERIAFVENVEDLKKRGDGVQHAGITKLSAKAAFVAGYDYIIELFTKVTAHWVREQYVAAIYHELRHISPRGTVSRAHDVEDFDELLGAFGAHWAHPGAPAIADLLNQDFDWSHLQPPSLFLVEGGKVGAN